MSLQRDACLRVQSFLRHFCVVYLCLGMVLGCASESDAPSQMDATVDPTDVSTLQDMTMSGDQNVGDSMVETDLSLADGSVADMSVADASTNDASLVDAFIEDMDVADAAVADASYVDAEPEEPSCVPPVSRLQYEVWPMVFDGRCTICHYEGGSADQHPSDIDFVLRDPSEPGRFETSADVHAYNLELIIANRNDENGDPYFLRKATGAIAHGGGAQLEVGTPEYQALEALFEQYDLFQMDVCEDDHEESVSYQQVMDRVELRTPSETFRAFTVQALGRLPTADELSQIRRGNTQRPMLSAGMDAQSDSRNDTPGATLSDAPIKSQITVVRQLIDGLRTEPAFRNWLKDQWNDVFMFRGIYAQDFDRAWDVFSPHDFGARAWSDMCGTTVPLTDENGEYIDGPGEQPLCNVLQDRFDYPAIASPAMTPAEACNDCQFSRRGIAYWMLYGAVEEPLELIASIIQERRPFTEIVTSEDIMMNYYTSMVYFATADPAQNEFVADMRDVPMHEALMNGPTFVKYDVSMPDHRIFKPYTTVYRTKYEEPAEPVLPNATRDVRDFVYKDPQDFPRAGILSSAAFMKRFPGSSLNMQRHRAWQTMRLLLGYDILMNQGDRVSIADVQDPNGGATVANDDCANCHQILDPVAGLFRDFSGSGNSYPPASAENRWSRDIHQPGTGGLGPDGAYTLHDRDVHGPPIQYLGQLIATDPRFPKAMVRHAWRQVVGEDPIAVASNLEGTDFEARTALLFSQDRFIKSLEDGFVRRNFDLMWVYRQLFTSNWYRAKGLIVVDTSPISDEVYEGVGRFGTLTPEEYFRRIEAVYGEPWPLRVRATDNRTSGNEHKLKRDFFVRTDSEARQFDLMWGMLDDSFAAFYGGIDFQNNLTRAEQMNSIMSLVGRRVANEFACLAVYPDLQREPAERRMFGALRSDIHGDDPLPVAEVKNAIADLFDRILGYQLAPDDPEVTHAYDLWVAVRDSIANSNDRDAGRLTTHCAIHEAELRGEPNRQYFQDPHGRTQAWMAVVTYLMMQPEFVQR